MHVSATTPAQSTAERCARCWRLALTTTTHCLTGCAIGEVAGLAIATALGLANVPSIVLAVVLAFFFGYSLAMWPLLRGGLALGAALSVALAADTLSITVMELIDNAIILLIPGAMEAGLSEGLFWGSLAFALAVAFAATWPINYLLISRGRIDASTHRSHQARGHA